MKLAFLPLGGSRSLVRMLLGIVLGLCALATPSLYADLYVAPTAQGTGSGSSAANAAYYLNGTFWSSTVQTAVNSAATTVWFANGTYTAGSLMLQNLGHPNHTCTLRATTDGSVTLKADGQNNILWLRGSQNFALRGFRFTGTPTQAALSLSYYPTPTKTPTRNIDLYNCWFEDLTNLSLGAIIFGANRDITIDTCHFDTVTGPTPPQVHAIYAGGVSQNISITGCDFTDVGGEYVRFRNDTEYAAVTDCTFHSTAVGYNQPFISVPLYNTISPYANEFYGGNFQFTGNVFRYDVHSDLTGYYRHAHYFYNSGYDAPPGDALEYYVTSSQATTLNTGTQAQKEAILSAGMQLSNSRIKIYNEEYHGVVRATAYRAYHGSTSFNDSGYYTTPVDISNWPGTSGTVLTAPILRNGQFDELGNRLRKWFTFSGNAPVDHPGLNGSTKAIKLAKASNTEFGQWVRGPLSSTVTLHCLFAVGSFTGTGVKFQMQLYHNEVTNACLAFAVDDLGRCGYMNGSTFVPVTALGTIQFSVDANGNGSYSDAGDTLRWYQLRITVDYSGGTPHFDIARGVANTASDYTYNATGLTAWVNGSPSTGSTVGLLNFKNTSADVIVDECW